MKNIIKLLLVLIVFLGSVAQAQLGPKFTVATSVTGKIENGIREFRSLNLPKEAKVASASVSAGPEVEVTVVKFDFVIIGVDNRVESIENEISTEEALKIVSEAGYRPATIIEVLAVRQRLTKCDLTVCVYGSQATLEGRKYYFSLDYHYVPGEDIMPYINGKIVLSECNWRDKHFSLSFAVVKI